MNSRERVLASIHHKEPDRIPKDLGSTNVTGITAAAYEGLLDLLGYQEEIIIVDRIQGLAQVSPAVRENLGIDTYGLWPKSSKEGIREEGRDEKGQDYFIDEWGLYWRKPVQGLYYDVVKSPLNDINPGKFDVASYEWPDKNDTIRIEGMREESQRIRKETDLAIVLCETLDFFLFCLWLRGFENFLTDIYLHPEFARNLLDTVLDIQLTRTEHVLKEAGEFIDVVGVIGDDWGTQDSLYVAPEMFHEIFKPRIARMVDTIRQYTDAPIFAHSCGSVRKLIPDFIDMGFNILNPLQVSAKDMNDTDELKKQFGDRITFWGGGIDTQHVLNHGGEDDIEREVKKRIMDLAPGGGFVFCPVHNIQADVPPENIVHAYRIADEFGIYPIRS